MKLGGVERRGRHADRVAAARARARRPCSRRSAPAPSSRSRTAANAAHRRAVGALVQARPLVRRRLRPRPRRDPRVPRRPHRRRRRSSANPTRSRAPADFRPDDHIEDRPWLLGDDDPGHRPSARRRRPTPTGALGELRADATVDAGRRRHRRRRADGHEPRRVPLVRARPPRPRRGPRHRPSSAPTSSPGSNSSRRGHRHEPATRSRAPSSSASSRWCRGSSRTRAPPRPRSRSGSASRSTSSTTTSRSC